MDALVMVAFLVVWAGGWWWLAKRMKAKDRGWFLRNLAGSTAGLFAGLVVVALALEVGLIHQAKPKEQAPAEVASTEQAPTETAVEPTPPVQVEDAPADAQKPVKTLGIQPEQYVDRVNAALEQLGKNVRINASDITVGEVNDVLNAKLGEHAALIAGISKINGEVQDLTVIGAGDGTPASGLEIMMMASVALSATGPDVDYKGVFKQLPAMMDGKPLTYGNVKLSAKTMEQLGTWFFAAPI